MTVKELYEHAKALMFEKKNSNDYDGYYIQWINMLLSENFDLNNGLRVSRRLPELLRVPFISHEDDEIAYEEDLTYEVLGNGLASKFFIDDDLSKFNLFDTEYRNAQGKYVRFNVEDETYDFS